MSNYAWLGLATRAYLSLGVLRSCHTTGSDHAKSLMDLNICLRERHKKRRTPPLHVASVYLLGSFDFTFVAINPVNPLIVEPGAFHLGRSISHFKIPDLQLKAALKLPPEVFW